MCTCSVPTSWDWITDQGDIPKEDDGRALSMTFLSEGASQHPAGGSASPRHEGDIHVFLCTRVEGAFQPLEDSCILSLSLSLSSLSLHLSLSSSLDMYT